MFLLALVWWKSEYTNRTNVFGFIQIRNVEWLFISATIIIDILPRQKTVVEKNKICFVASLFHIKGRLMLNMCFAWMDYFQKLKSR